MFLALARNCYLKGWLVMVLTSSDHRVTCYSQHILCDRTHIYLVKSLREIMLYIFKMPRCSRACIYLI